ncbi:MAG: hypothetical protein ABIK07_05460 [Planctomycetota bacterium]
MNEDIIRPALEWLDIIPDDDIMYLLNFYYGARDWDGVDYDLDDGGPKDQLGDQIAAEVKRRGLK